MTEVLRAKHAIELDEVSRVIHDSFFDLEAVNFDPAARVLTIPFRKDDSSTGHTGALVSRARGRGCEWLLAIRNVESYEIEDPEKVRYYDFNRLIYDPSKHVLSLSTGIPIRVDVHVSMLEITVENTGRIVEYH